MAKVNKNQKKTAPAGRERQTVKPSDVGKLPPPPAARQTAVAPASSTALATRAGIADLMAADVGAGLQGLDAAKDLAVPRLAIVQALSAICQKNDPLYDAAAEQGMILENVSNTLYSGEEGILLVLVSYRRSYINWWPRNSRAGKGFIKDYGTDDSIMAKTKRDEKTGANLLPDGSEIVMTAEYFGLLIDEETGQMERVLIPMAKTQYSKSKKLLTQATTLIAKETGKPAPLFYRAYRFSTVPESNDHGSWYGWKIEPGPNTLDLPDGENIYLAARAYREGVSAGTVKVSQPGEAEGSTGTAAPGEDAPM